NFFSKARSSGRGWLLRSSPRKNKPRLEHPHTRGMFQILAVFFPPFPSRTSIYMLICMFVSDWVLVLVHGAITHDIFSPAALPSASDKRFSCFGTSGAAHDVRLHNPRSDDSGSHGQDPFNGARSGQPDRRCCGRE